MDKAVEKYNELARANNLRKCLKLTSARKKHLNARLAEFGFDGWMEVLHKVHGSSFLTGRTGTWDYRAKTFRFWKADFDFIVSESGFIKIMEGKYDGL